MVFPPYLWDLRNTEPDEIFAPGVSTEVDEAPDADKDCSFRCGPFHTDTVLQYMTVNTVQQFDVDAADHPSTTCS